MMKKLCRYVMASIMLVVIFGVSILNCIDVNANSNLAVSAGMLYSNIDTRQDARDASAAYGTAGYTTVTMEAPTMARFTAPRLAAGILFFSGHGTNNYMNFEPEFSIYCQSGPVSSLDLNIYSTASNQKLITFAGCETASQGTSNITYRAYIAGADAAVGWTTTVLAGSHTNWLKRYNDALAEGYPLNEAMGYANSFYYLPGSGVKNGLFYGNGNLTITSSKSVLTSKKINTNDDQNLLNSGYTLATEEDMFFSATNDSLISKIKSIFVSNDKVYEDEELIAYLYENDKGKMIDVYFKHNDVITNMSITVQLDATGTIKGYKLHNMSNEKFFTLNAQLKNVKVKYATDSFKKCIMEKEKMKIASTDQVIEQRQFEYYDVNVNETYLVTYTEVIDEVGAKYVFDDMSLIE